MPEKVFQIIPPNQYPENVQNEYLTSARSLLALARKEAKELLQDAAQKANNIRLNAYAEGFQVGLSAAAEQLLDSVSMQRRALLAAEADALDLVIQIAREVVGVCAHTSPERLAERIHNSLHDLLHQNGIQVFVHPSLTETITSKLSLPEYSPVSVLADPSLCPNAVRIESSAGTIECSNEAHLEAIIAVLKEGTRISKLN